MSRLLASLLGAAIAVALVSSSVFVVDQNRYAVVYALGELREVIKEPGLNVKAPPPFQNVVYLDKRLQTLDTPDGERFLTAEKKDLLVDAFVKWRIVNPRQYVIAIGSNADRGGERLNQLVRNALTAEIGKRNLADVLTGGKRADVASAVRADLVQEAKDLGVEVVDVHLKRIDFIDQVNNAVYERMKADRVRVANELRATGVAEAETIRADAERQRSVILADAQRDAETIKGEGVADLGPFVRQEPGVLPVLPLDGGLQGHLQGAQRRDRDRLQLRVLQVFQGAWRGKVIGK
jgi:membrane protease subunit HflC